MRIGHLLHQETWVDQIPSQDIRAHAMETDRSFGCMQCRRNFASFAGECVHMCRAHGVIAKERFLFDGTQCPNCLREYRTHSKVLAHLRNTERCRNILHDRRLHCQPTPGIGSQRDRELIEVQDGALPLLQAQGPQLPQPVQNGWEPHDIQFFEALYMHLVDGSQEVALLDYVREFISNYPISWTQCHLTLETFCDQFTITDADVLVWSHEEVLHCIKQMTRVCNWDFLRDSQAAVVTHSPANLCDWENWCADLATSPPESWMHVQPLPQSLTRQKVLLHTFAGRRRRGDVEWYLDMISKQTEGCVVLTVSIDIVIDPIHGDIAREDMRVMWLHYIRMGHVAGFLAGPPCNTWSGVRAVEIADQHGPRVIRTPDAPWGINVSCIK